MPKFSHNTSLLQALKVKKIDNILQVQQLSLLRNAFLNESKDRTFYLHMFKRGISHTDKNLLSRCSEICKAHCVADCWHIFLDSRVMSLMNIMLTNVRDRYMLCHRMVLLIPL